MDEKKTGYRTYTEEFKLEALELLKNSWKTALTLHPGLSQAATVRTATRTLIVFTKLGQAHTSPVGEAGGGLFFCVVAVRAATGGRAFKGELEWIKSHMDR
jgi:hypothetical protein